MGESYDRDDAVECANRLVRHLEKLEVDAEKAQLDLLRLAALGFCPQMMSDGALRLAVAGKNAAVVAASIAEFVSGEGARDEEVDVFAPGNY